MPKKSPSLQYFTDPEASMFNMLRRLQEHTRSDIPAMMAHRAMSSFTLHPEPMPTEAMDDVLVVVYPQNPFVGEPEVRRMNTQDVRGGLDNNRVRIQDRNGVIAIPDEDGNYMYWPGSPEFDQVNAFYYTTFTLRMHERYARRVIPWAFPNPRLIVDANIGDRANAFYDEQNRLLGFHTFKSDGQQISTARSADIVSHEAAHAVLDGVRDLYNESFGLGPTAFHESFGDITAMLVALHDDSLIRRLLDWTYGDLRTSNFVTEVAEHLIVSLLNDDEREHLEEHTIYLRNALNQLKNIGFDELPYMPADPELQMGREPHNFSRLFTGAFYDIFVGFYERLSEKMPKHIAIYRARDSVGYILMTAVELGPVGECDFSDMAKAFLTAENVLYDGKYADILASVYADRLILAQAESQAHIESLKKLPTVRLPDSLNSALAVALFLENEVLPALKLSLEDELVPMATYRNARGHAFLTFFSSKQVRLVGQQYGKFHDSVIDVFGGLTLMFDENNRLRSVCHRPVIEQDIAQIRLLVAEYIEHGLIVDYLLLDTAFMPQPAPKGLWVSESSQVQADEQPHPSKLVKFPVIVDPIPQPITELPQYLKSVGTKIDEE